LAREFSYISTVLDFVLRILGDEDHNHKKHGDFESRQTRVARISFWLCLQQSRLQASVWDSRGLKMKTITEKTRGSFGCRYGWTATLYYKRFFLHSCFRVTAFSDQTLKGEVFKVVRSRWRDCFRVTAFSDQTLRRRQHTVNSLGRRLVYGHFQQKWRGNCEILC